MVMILLSFYKYYQNSWYSPISSNSPVNCEIIVTKLWFVAWFLFFYDKNAILSKEAGSTRFQNLQERFGNILRIAPLTFTFPKLSFHLWALDAGDNITAVNTSPDRRCSTRLLSASVHQTLKQLQKEQYEQRVAHLVKRNKIFYRYYTEFWNFKHLDN